MTSFNSTFLPDHGLYGLWDAEEAQEIGYDISRPRGIRTAEGFVDEQCMEVRHEMWVQRLGVSG